MQMSNCRKCKKLFTKFNNPICEDCEKEEEELFLSVRNYLREYPKATLAKVGEETGVSAKKILGYLRDGRLELATMGDLKCRSCGIDITGGHLCSPCHASVGKEIAGLLGELAPPPPEKEAPITRQKAVMHTTRRR